MTLTKLDMSKVVVTALYNLPELVVPENSIQWKHAVKMARCQHKDELTIQYNRAHKILTDRNKV